MNRHYFKSLFKLNRIKLYMQYLFSRNNNDYQYINMEKRKIIIGLAADYSNLGDVAITLAQTKYFEDNFPEYEIIDFPISQTFKKMKSLKKICNSEDVITIVGGGNTGNIYDSTEYCRQFLIQNFPNNKIVSFPQTVDFSNDFLGKRALKTAKKVYRKHNNLTLIAREEKSYNFYKDNFAGSQIMLLPDIVLYLNEGTTSYTRKGITLSLRNDGEKNFDMTKQSKLINYLMESGEEIKHYDTDIKKKSLSIIERRRELDKIWTAFKKSEIVITDRLHGMIFCAITQTPCIAMNNSNGKVIGVYKKWLSEINYIETISNFDLNEISEKLRILRSKSTNDVEMKDYSRNFIELNQLFE